MSQTMVASKDTVARGMLEEFERELATTRRFLERLQEERLSWRPHEKSMSAGQLGHHIAETPGLALRFALQDRGAPPDFREREEARKDHVFGLLGGGDVLGPDIRLCAEHVPSLSWRKFGGHRLEGVDLVQRRIAADRQGFGGWVPLVVIEVEV